MYSIKQASIRSGVSIPLLRAWERRYRVVTPTRTASGYRLYDDDAIATLVRVRELTESGWTPSEASRAVLAGEVEVGPVATRVAVTDGVPATSTQADLIEAFVQAAKDIDLQRTGAILDEMLALGSFESVADDLLMPALVALGNAWGEGSLDVAAEHAASAAVLRRLAALFEAAAQADKVSVVVGMPPGARHELGALAFAVALRRLGVGVLYLGADVPVASWVHAIERTRARLAVIAIVQQADRTSALAVLEAARSIDHAPVLAVGGRNARWGGGREAGIVVLPERIVDAAKLAAGIAGGSITTGQEQGARS
jgi:DNA-binding transcriptional MerR regulator/methylmalonyl-CoA mutase cobalamin-binding subunit